MGHNDTHPLWIVGAMVDMIRPIEFQDTLRLRRWCSGASTRWCGDAGAHRRTQKAASSRPRHSGSTSIARPRAVSLIAEDFMEGLPRHRHQPVAVEVLPQGRLREDAEEIREFPIRVSDIDLFDHVNNSVYWKVVEEFPRPAPGTN